MGPAARSEDRKTVSLVLELCRGPSLQQALLQRGQALPEDEARLSSSGGSRRRPSRRRRPRRDDVWK